MYQGHVKFQTFIVFQKNIFEFIMGYIYGSIILNILIIML